MATFRKIVNVTNGSINLELPDSFKEGEVEVTVRSAKETESESKKEPRGDKNAMLRHFGAIPDFPDIEHEGEYEERDPLD
ncbi:MAG: hypothetical protein KC978_24040 [Candidatus Omnitrophica bacterium]|nr:hypothetical protein [Candidatus Omnitrophota bacterium]